MPTSFSRALCVPSASYRVQNANIVNPMVETDLGEATGVHKTPTASPREPVTPKRPPKRPRPETPRKEPPIPFPPLMNQRLPAQAEGDTPPATPTHNSSGSQLGLELQSHIAAAVASRTTQIKSTGDEVIELVHTISQKISRWEEKSLYGAASLGKDIRTLFLNFSKSLATEQPAGEEKKQQLPLSKQYSYAGAARITPNAPKAPPRMPKSTQPEKLPRLFLRLPKDHPARQASTHATMEVLRKHLDGTCSSAVKEIQQVPSGLAIWPKDGLGLRLLAERRETLETLIQGAKTETEQAWAVFVLPNAPLDYTGYDGAQVPINDQMALDEFKLQTGLLPLKFYRSNKTPHSSTLVMATHEAQAHTVPQWVHLFGKNIQIKRKIPRARIEQCTRCWDYHNPRTCSRSRRCRVCSRKDHTEETHPHSNANESELYCTNCCRPSPADHPDCPARPTLKQGIIQRLSRSQLLALRKAGERQHMRTLQSESTQPIPEHSRDPGSSPTSEQSQSC